MRTLSSEVEEQLTVLNQDGIWARLYEFEVDDTERLFFTDHNSTVNYNGINYTPYPIKIEDQTETAKPEMRNFNVVVANIDGSFSLRLEQNKILGRDIKITLVFIRNST